MPFIASSAKSQILVHNYKFLIIVNETTSPKSVRGKFPCRPLFYKCNCAGFCMLSVQLEMECTGVCKYQNCYSCRNIIPVFSVINVPLTCSS